MANSNSLLKLDGLESNNKSKPSGPKGKSNKKNKLNYNNGDEIMEIDSSDNISDDDNLNINSSLDIVTNNLYDESDPMQIKSNSSNEDMSSEEVDSETETMKTKSKKNLNNDESNSDKDISEQKKKKKKDKILDYKLSENESDEDGVDKTMRKKQNAEKNKNEDDDVVEHTPNLSKKKRSRKVKKKTVIDSDSDCKEISSNDDEENKSEEPAESDKAKKKKKKVQKRQRTSDSDSSVEEVKPKPRRRRIKKAESSDDDDEKKSGNKSGRKNIRKVMKDKQVADETKEAAKEEEDRLKRIAERQKMINEMYETRLAGEAKVEKLVLDINEETKEELIAVEPELVKRLKPHQAEGIKFMWTACFESLEAINKDSGGGGCIIAHCMGLGKTFQVITLIHTLFRYEEETNIRTVMVICPLSTVLNWKNEFKMWLRYTKEEDEIEIYELTKFKQNTERKYRLETWQRTGGVLIIGYEMFRNLTTGGGKKMRKAMQESIQRSLVNPGADLVVCDEGHLLKNEDSAISKAVNLIKTRRRIVLTGTPLQNNLKEYHCMVQFIKPNLLGTKKEFLNRFVNPITNGQFEDSTDYDVKIMKKRAHCLHKLLEGFVQRFDYSVLTPFLPPKQEYVIFVRLTDIQIKMYQYYLDNCSRRYRSGGAHGTLFADFQELQRIWTHPFVLRLNQEKVEKANEKKRLEASDSEGSLKDFIVSGSESNSSSSDSSDVQCLDSDNETFQPLKRNTRANPVEEAICKPEEPEEPEVQWWSQFVEDQHFRDMTCSNKLLMLFEIIKESQKIGDKVLVFSQSLYSLTLIEEFLNLIDQESQNGNESELLLGHKGNWTLGADYFRLDGSTSPENRSAWCKIFNNEKNTRARLFLISTRAGGLGINLTAANRVIIFDASWNPSHDVQSIFRIYRFGQKKSCYVYRFLAAGTMEEKIYNRQVTKLSLSCRVVDEQQIERHYSNHNLAELYQFEPNIGKEVPLNLPKDRVLADIFLKYKDKVYNYHEHDSLLENKEEEELDEEERKKAWEEYQAEKEGRLQPPPMQNYYAGTNHMQNPFFMPQIMPELSKVKELIQKDYPNLPPEHLDVVARQAIFDMYRYLDQNNPFNFLPQGTRPVNVGTSNMYNQPQRDPLALSANHTGMPQVPMHQQMNFVNTMPTYSGRGRPPKHVANMQNALQNQAMGIPMNQNIPPEPSAVSGINSIREEE